MRINSDKTQVQSYHYIGAESDDYSIQSHLFAFGDFGEQIILSCIRHDTAWLDYTNILTNTKPGINIDLDYDYINNHKRNSHETYDYNKNEWFVYTQVFDDFLDGFINNNFHSPQEGRFNYFNNYPHGTNGFVYLIVRENENDLIYVSILLDAIEKLNYDSQYKIITVLILCRNEKGADSDSFHYIERADAIVDIGVSYNVEEYPYSEYFFQMKDAVSAVLACQLGYANYGVIGVDYVDIQLFLTRSNYIRVVHVEGISDLFATSKINTALEYIEDDDFSSEVEMVLFTCYATSPHLIIHEKITGYLNSRYKSLKAVIPTLPHQSKKLGYNDEIYILVGARSDARMEYLSHDISTKHLPLEASVSLSGTIHKIIISAQEIGFNRIIEVEFSGVVHNFQDIKFKGETLRVANLRDDTSEIEVIIYQDMFEQLKSLCAINTNVHVTGALGLKEENGLCNVVVHEMYKL